MASRSKHTFFLKAGVLAIAGFAAFTSGCGRSTPKPAEESLQTTPDSIHPSSAMPIQSLEYKLAPVECSLADTKRAAARVTPRFYFSDPSLKAEIVQKQDAVARLLQFIVSTKRPAEIDADSLAAEFKRRLYPLLSPEKITRIVFDFELFLKDSL